MYNIFIYPLNKCMQHVFMYFPYGCHQSHAISCFSTQDAGMDPTIRRLTGKSPCPGGWKPHWGRQPVESQEKPAGIQHQNARRMFLFQKKHVERSDSVKIACQIKSTIIL